MGNNNENQGNNLKQLVNMKVIWSKDRVKECQALLINSNIIETHIFNIFDFQVKQYCHEVVVISDSPGKYFFHFKLKIANKQKIPSASHSQMNQKVSIERRINKGIIILQGTQAPQKNQDTDLSNNQLPKFLMQQQSAYESKAKSSYIYFSKDSDLINQISQSLVQNGLQTSNRKSSIFNVQDYSQIVQNSQSIIEDEEQFQDLNQLIKPKVKQLFKLKQMKNNLKKIKEVIFKQKYEAALAQLEPICERLKLETSKIILKIDFGQKLSTNQEDFIIYYGLYLSYLGNILALIGKGELALVKYQQILKIYDKLKGKGKELFEFEQALILNNIGGIYLSLRNYTLGLQYLTQSLIIYRRTKGQHQGQSDTLGNIGYAHYNLGDNLKALQFYTESLRICERLQKKTGIGQQDVLYNIGIVYQNQKDYQNALIFFQRLLLIQTQLDRPTQNTIAMIAKCKLKLNS